MAIRQYRVDFRMLHGQVCAAFGSVYGIDEYLVVNAETAKDDFQVSLLEMAAISSAVRVVSPKEAYGIITSDDLEGRSTMVVFKEIEDAVELIVDLGLGVKSLQISGMFAKTGRNRKQYDLTLFADDQDCAAFRKLEDAGVDLTFQVVPDYKAKKLSALVRY